MCLCETVTEQGHFSRSPAVTNSFSPLLATYLSFLSLILPLPQLHSLVFFSPLPPLFHLLSVLQSWWSDKGIYPRESKGHRTEVREVAEVSVERVTLRIQSSQGVEIKSFNHKAMMQLCPINLNSFTLQKIIFTCPFHGTHLNSLQCRKRDICSWRENIEEQFKKCIITVCYCTALSRHVLQQ